MSDNSELDDLTFKIPNEKMLEDMIIEEEKRRMSEEYRNECTSVKNIINGWLAVTEKMQKDIVKSFGFQTEMECDIACNMMRRAHILYPENEIFRTVPLQVRNNKAKKGDLVLGSNVPNFPIFTLDKKICSIESLIDNDKYNKPSVIIMSSGT